ncbi:acyl-CoA dehydrogenase family protein [Streptomyces sp. NPDC051740]|uniref:acyl-CoA dehydrogenase family protein n=1 Tax=Streptomyces sp. NPDC051740 TaxID=3365673 RepID=UPI0037A35817
MSDARFEARTGPAGDAAASGVPGRAERGAASDVRPTGPAEAPDVPARGRSVPDEWDGRAGAGLRDGESGAVARHGRAAARGVPVGAEETAAPVSGARDGRAGTRARATGPVPVGDGAVGDGAVGDGPARDGAAGNGAGEGGPAGEAAVSDPPSSLAAESDGPDGWRLTGEKCWISNAPEADFYTVFARTTPGAGARGVTAFLVPADRPGLTGAALDMLSPHPIGALRFDAVPVTAGDVLGEVDRGFRVAMDTLNLFRPSVGAFAVGMAQAALDATLAHTARRDAFGGKLKDLQSVAHQVAEMALRTESARLMVYAAATAYDEGADGVPGRAAMAKLLATETAQYVVDRAVQLHGARALQRGHLLEHLYREVRAPRVYEGASEVQRGIIAKELYRNLEDR